MLKIWKYIMVSLVVIAAYYSLCLINAGGELSLDDNTVALWHFDDGSGNTLNDSSPNKNDGEIHGATWNNNGMYSNCLEFDGTNDYVSMPSTALNSLPNGTVELWFKLDSFDKRQTLISKTDPEVIDHLLIQYEPKDSTIEVTISNSIQNTIHTIDYLDWVYLAVTWGNGIREIYINGTMDSSISDNSVIGDSGCAIEFGRSPVLGGKSYFHGKMDEVRFSNSVRDNEEISGAARVTYENNTYINNSYINNTYLNVTYENHTQYYLTYENSTYQNITHENQTHIHQNFTYINETNIQPAYTNETYFNITYVNITYQNQTQNYPANNQSDQDPLTIDVSDKMSVGDYILIVLIIFLLILQILILSKKTTNKNADMAMARTDTAIVPEIEYTPQPKIQPKVKVVRGRPGSTPTVTKFLPPPREL